MEWNGKTVNNENGNETEKCEEQGRKLELSAIKLWPAYFSFFFSGSFLFYFRSFFYFLFLIFLISRPVPFFFNQTRFFSTIFFSFSPLVSLFSCTHRVPDFSLNLTSLYGWLMVWGNGLKWMETRKEAKAQNKVQW